jgi:hypothetical protein
VLFPDSVGTETAHCDHCGQYYRAGEEPDPCIGRHLTGVAGCCCGHGDLSRAYVDMDTAWDEATAATTGHWNHDMLRSILLRHRLTGEAALDFLSDHRCGPNLIPRSQVRSLPGPLRSAWPSGNGLATRVNHVGGALGARGVHTPVHTPDSDSST